MILQDIEHFSSDGKVLWFGASVRALYDPLLDQVLNRWGARIATSDLSNRLNHLILDDTPTTSTLDKVTRFAETLDAEDPHYRAIIPLNGIRLSAPLRVSPLVELVIMQDALFDTLVGSALENICAVNQQFTDEQKDRYRNLAAEAKDFLRDKVCMVAELAMDADKILESLIEKDDESGEGLPIVDFLQFCIACAAPQYQRSIVDWRFLYRSDAVMVPYPMASPDGEAYSLKVKRGGNAPHLLTAQELHRLRELGVLDIVHLFDGLSEGNDYDQMLYLAIRAFAEGEREQSSRARLLHYTTAFELFFSEARETTRAVSEGVAYLWTTDARNRMAVATTIADIYGGRSRSSHAGQRGRYVREARHIALNIIISLIRKRGEFKTKKAFQDWLAYQRFSSMPMAPVDNVDSP